jgi:hypothetical protein
VAQETREVVLRQIKDLMRGDNIPAQTRNIDTEQQASVTDYLTSSHFIYFPKALSAVLFINLHHVSTLRIS